MKTSFYEDCETTRTLKTLTDTRNNPERVKLHLKQHRQTLDYMGLIFERLSTYPPTHSRTLIKIKATILKLIFSRTLLYHCNLN